MIISVVQPEGFKFAHWIVKATGLLSIKLIGGWMPPMDYKVMIYQRDDGQWFRVLGNDRYPQIIAVEDALNITNINLIDAAPTTGA